MRFTNTQYKITTKSHRFRRIGKTIVKCRRRNSMERHLGLRNQGKVKMCWRNLCLMETGLDSPTSSFFHFYECLASIFLPCCEQNQLPSTLQSLLSFEPSKSNKYRDRSTCFNINYEDVGNFDLLSSDLTWLEFIQRARHQGL